MMGLVGACQCHITDGAGDASVAVLKGMDGDEPKMRHARHEDGVGGVFCKP